MKRALALLLLLPAFRFQEDPAPKELFSKVDSEIEWMSDGVRLPDGESIGKRRTRPTTDPESIFFKAFVRAKKENRLVLWYVPRVNGGHMNRATVVDTYLRVVAFTDPDVVDLINAKFVPIRVVSEGPIEKEYKIRKFSFVEPGFVFLTPDGEIVHKIDRIRTFSADWVYHALRSVLKKHDKYNRTRARRALDLVKGGDLEEALKKNPGPMLKARIHRLLRQGNVALAALRGENTPEAATERGRILLALGEIEKSREHFEEGLKGLRGAESEYYLGLADYWSNDEASAKKRFRKVMKTHPESRWAWRAASNFIQDTDTLMTGPMVHGYEEVFWAPKEGYGDTGTRWAQKDSDAVAKRAVEYLLRAQRSNGGWEDSRYVYCPSPKILPNVFTAVTALSAAALHEWRDVAPDRVEAALKKAEAYMFDPKNMNRGRNEDMYADAYRLIYLVRSKGSVERMNEIVKELAKSQKRNGFWAHEYPNPFCTAAVVHALHLAKDAGADVDESMFRKAAEGLKATRGEGGRQAYARGRPSSAKNSMARSAMCELALFEAGEATRDDIAKALDAYWKFLKRLEAVRVCDFHADQELGGFFFFHGVFHSSEAARALKGDRRKEHLSKFVEQVLSIPELDGSFIDSHELGKSYGTAMGLLVLKNGLDGK